MTMSNGTLSQIKDSRAALQLLVKKHNPEQSVETTAGFFRFIGLHEIDRAIDVCGRILREVRSKYDLSWSDVPTKDGNPSTLYVIVYNNQRWECRVDKKMEFYDLVHSFMSELKTTDHVGKLCARWANKVLMPSLRSRIEMLDLLTSDVHVSGFDQEQVERVAREFARHNGKNYSQGAVADMRIMDVETMVAICHVTRQVGISFNFDKKEIWRDGLHHVELRYPAISQFSKHEDWPIVETLYLMSCGKDWSEAIPSRKPGPVKTAVEEKIPTHKEVAPAKAVGKKASSRKGPKPQTLKSFAELGALNGDPHEQSAK